jgi:hypothetical protein
MSTFGRLRYRTPFLELGNSEAAESRYRTVTLLLKSGARTNESIGQWLQTEVTGPFEQTIRLIIES